MLVSEGVTIHFRPASKSVSLVNIHSWRLSGKSQLRALRSEPMTVVTFSRRSYFVEDNHVRDYYVA